MYVDTSRSKQNGKTYKRVLLRESYREGGKVKHRTIANLSRCSEQEIEAIKLALKHKHDLSEIGALDQKMHCEQGLSVGAILVLKALADRLHITKALGNSVMGKLALWQVMARVIDQGSRLSSVRLAQSHAVCDVLNIDGFNEDDLYANLDWLCDNQEKIELSLFRNRYSDKEPPKLYLYDVTSSYLEGLKNELGDWGYNRDKKRGKLQIVIGLLTDSVGVPVSVEVFKGNTTDMKTFINQVKKLSERFGIKEVTLVGDRGMIKSTQIADLKEEDFHYITAITKSQIDALINQNIFQLDLFSETVCEVENEGMRYILRRNPVRVNEIVKTRKEKMDKVNRFIDDRNEYLLSHRRAQVATAEKNINKLIDKLKIKKIAYVDCDNRRFSLKINKEELAKASKLDGCYVIKTDLAKEDVSSELIHDRYKDLSLVEQGFRTMKTGLLETRPVYVRKEKRTKGHVFVVMLAYIITHELSSLWAELDITLEEGINELTTIDSVQVKVDDKTYSRIPKPRELGQKLLRLADVSLPAALSCRNANVATRKKLNEHRKSK